jgi:hypothetical protein
VPAVEPEVSAAREAWYLMGGRIDWAAMPTVVELLGIHDVELFIERLVTIRDYAASQH